MKLLLALGIALLCSTLSHTYRINSFEDEANPDYQEREKRNAAKLHNQDEDHDATVPDSTWYGPNTDSDDVSLYLAAKKKAKKNRKKQNKKRNNKHKRRSTFSYIAEVEQDKTEKDYIITALGRQLMLQQLFVEERIRSDGGSGIKNVRVNSGGTRPYYYAHHTSGSVASIHDHANNIRTVGMGEFIVVVNGVEFRTRHNDYRLKQPHQTDPTYHATEDIEFPGVPEEVTDLETVEEQIEEMRIWFKAFKDQNTTLRDYRPYFPAVLCYLEGAWNLAESDNVDEPFESDRHVIDASTWFDLQEKVRFTSATGRKSQLENFAYLPTTILEMINGTMPRFAQWNYRIMCHKITRDVPTNRLRPIDELAPRFANKWTYSKYLESRAARFQLHDHPHHIEKEETDTFLDTLMYEIPGKDNYQGDIIDDAMGATVYHINSQNNEPANAARYHRYFKVDEKGAMGLKIRHRGFSDPNLFVALTTQDKIAPFSYSECTGKNNNKVCTKISQRVSYAIPLEIIYLSPLSEWNPYDIEYKGDSKSDEGKTVNALNDNGEYRTGQNNVERAFNGTHSKLYYRTPVDFFTNEYEGSGAPADTTRNSVGVLDRNGDLHIVKASGTRIFFPDIEEVGKIRQRYPIMPVHAEGSAVWKKLSALEDAVMKMGENLALYRDIPPFEGVAVVDPAVTYTFYTSVSHKPSIVDNHHHYFTVSAIEFDQMKNEYQRFVYTTSTNNGHSHELEVKYKKKIDHFIMTICDDNYICWDDHDKELTFEED